MTLLTCIYPCRAKEGAPSKIHEATANDILTYDCDSKIRATTISTPAPAYADEYNVHDCRNRCYQLEAGLTRDNPILITDDDDDNDTIPYIDTQTDYEGDLSGEGEESESTTISNSSEDKNDGSNSETLVEDDTQTDDEDDSCNNNGDTSEYTITWDHFASDNGDSDSDSSTRYESSSSKSSSLTDPIDIKIPQYSDDGDEFASDYE